MKTLNTHYNRLELDYCHVYLTDFGTEPRQEHEHEGVIKCKLIHAPWGSVIFPDQVYLKSDPLLWIQPLAFTPCLLGKLDDKTFLGDIWIDISCGNTVRVRFSHEDLLKKLQDGSELFSCKLYGPKNIADFSTGSGRFDASGVPELLLHHHTADETKPLIQASKHFRGSKWNIQGNKELVNIHYAYFTCLDRIKAHEDLIQIAMANDGKIHMIRDGFTPPPIMTDKWKEQYGNDILELEVYRESTANRTATISLFVESVALASQHLLFHQPPGQPAYYEIAKPFIYRIGLEPGATLPIDFDASRVVPDHLKRVSHIIAGDATTLDGLRAPFDEEHTKNIFKIEYTPEGESILSFWFSFSNRDHFTGKPLIPFEFKK